jgi:hypothetical protein
MKLLGLLPNPWLILGLLALLTGVGLSAYSRGHENGANSVQTAWDAESQARAEENKKLIRKNEAETRALQDAADAERKTSAEKYAAAQRSLTIALNGLRDRPERPGPGAADLPGAAGPGPSCTGAGLYRGDAEVLIRLAASARTVADQRDACYRRYGEARDTLNRINGSAGAAKP